MRVPEPILDDILLVLLGLVVVLCMLVGAFTLIGWPGPVLLLAGGLYYGWREVRAEMRGSRNARSDLA